MLIISINSKTIPVNNKVILFEFLIQNYNDFFFNKHNRVILLYSLEMNVHLRFLK